MKNLPVSFMKQDLVLYKADLKKMFGIFGVNSEASEREKLAFLKSLLKQNHRP